MKRNKRTFFILLLYSILFCQTLYAAMPSGFYPPQFNPLQPAGYYPHPGHYPMYPQLPMPMPLSLPLPLPLYHFPSPFYPPPPPYPGIGMPSPQLTPGMIPPGLTSIPGAESISAAAFNLPSQQGTSSDENIAGQLGNALQLPMASPQSNIPSSLLSANVLRPKSPQIGSSFMTAPAQNGPEKTAVQPEPLYHS